MPHTSPPNVVVILSDQHRFDCAGVYGNTQVSTPNIDALAADGITFDAAFCPFPICAPSRYSLLTSLYPHQHGAWKNGTSLPGGFPTFPHAFRDAGYHTAAVGKMHLTPTYAEVGFSDMVLAEQDGPGRHDDDYHRYLRREGLVDRVDLMDQVAEFRREAPDEYWNRFGALPSNLPEEAHSTTWIADRTIEAIAEWDERPQLLFSSFVKPHHPFDPPEPWDSAYDPAEIELLPGWLAELPPQDAARGPGYFPNEKLDPETIRRVTALYYGTISHMDHHIGRILEALKATGHYDNTIIVYASDHGEFMGFHHLILKHNYMYEPLVRVPLIMKLSGHAHAQQRRSSMVSLLDVAPTLAARCDVELAGEPEGRDIFAAPEREHIFAEFENEYMVRTERYKLLLHKEAERSRLIDLETDPVEVENHYEDSAYAEIRKHLERIARDTVLFDTWPPHHYDPHTPISRAANAQGPVGPHREESMAYFRGKMREGT